MGATYNAVLVQPLAAGDIGSPVNSMKIGVHNTYAVPVELSWKLGDSGFFVKTGLGFGIPDGTISGPNGLGSVGNPWWTIRPGLVVSYLKDGWNLTGAVYGEFNTSSTVTGYRSGNVIDAEFTATKAFGKWAIGPVGYYVGQVGDDKSSAFYKYAINANRFNIWAAGGLVSYNFGPATLTVWGVNEVSANASGGSPIPGLDRASTAQGWKVFGSVSYQLWAPEKSASVSPRLYK